jgi:putative transcription antitermination factor YqgF
VKVVAVDYGSARTGVAVSDPTGTIARPLGVVERASEEAGLKELADLIRAEEAERVVVGLPLTLRGERGAQAQETEAFVEALRAAVEVPVESFDERFTTKLAQTARGPDDARPPKRTPRSVVYRRRLVALGVLAAGFAIAWFIVSSFGGSGNDKPATTAVVAPRPFKIVFPEGFTRSQMARRVSTVAEIAKGERGRTPQLGGRRYLAATNHPRREPGFGRKRYPLEGFLFPATYDFTVHTTAPQLVGAQLDAFRANWAKVNLRYAHAKNLTPYDVLTIASMIESETAAPEERQLVAAVIYNRLHLHMALGIDATIRYGLHIPPTEPIHQSQLDSTNPYNTAHKQGLPPTPISNPGLASIQAAAHPAHVNFLYYVRKPDKKHHFFTASFAAFQAYKAAHGYR